MMIIMKLTDKQIEAAARAGVEAIGQNWDTLTFARSKVDARKWVEAAAPYLQLPWEMPTDREIDAAASSSYTVISRDATELLLRRFVNERNAALQPKPVDPRREAIMNALKQSVGVVESFLNGPECVADRILDAIKEIDEVKP